MFLNKMEKLLNIFSSLKNSKQVIKNIVCFLLIIAIVLPISGSGFFVPLDSDEPIVGETPDNSPPIEPVEKEAFINGEKLDQFSIVYSDEDSDYSKRAAEYIQKEIKNRTGLNPILIKDDEESRGTNEIVVGNTNREISSKLDAETTGLEFAILADEGNIALEGEYFIIAAAAYYFVETYIQDGNYSADIPTEISIHQPIVKDAKNYILLIGDGMGYYQTKLFDVKKNIYDYSDGESVFYGYYLPYQGFSRTDSLSGTTDSAAGGTALSCGIKTINGYVGIDKYGNDAKNMSEVALELGKAAGVMSTEVDTGATPSSFCAHVNDRNATEEIRIDRNDSRKQGVIIEGSFDYYTDSEIRDELEFYIEDTLNKLSKDEDGFFLMYEEAYIDKHSHDNSRTKAFQALLRFNQAIGRFMEFAFYNPDTFILITADHETGGLSPDEEGVLKYNTGNHTSANVPIFAYGMGAELFDGVEIENIQIAHTIAALMGEENFGDQSIYHSLTKK